MLILIGTPGSEPVQSHGGPALDIVWTLHLNGVELAKYSTRHKWIYDPKKRELLSDSRNAPWELRELDKRLREALDLK